MIKDRDMCGYANRRVVDAEQLPLLLAKPDPLKMPGASALCAQELPMPAAQRNHRGEDVAGRGDAISRRMPSDLEAILPASHRRYWPHPNLSRSVSVVTARGGARRRIRSSVTLI